MSNKNMKIRKGINFVPQASDPLSPLVGDVYFNSSLGMRIYIDGANDTVILANREQTLNNKTLVSPKLNEIVNTVTSDVYTLPNSISNDNLLSRTSTDTIINKSINADNNTITNIDNADIKASAAIEFSKMESLTSNRALISNGAGNLIVSTVTAAELSQLAGVTVGGTAAGDIVTLNNTQTLTNKTLTLPKINGVDDLTATSAELNQLDGVAVGGLSSGDIVDIDTAQTISSKTLSGFKYDEANVALAASIAKPSATIMHITGTPGTINAITGGADGDVRILVNETGDVITLGENVGADGFHTGAGADIDIQDNGSVQVIYEADAEGVGLGRWRVIGGTGSGSGSGNIKADLYDPVSTSLPTGTSATIDNQALADGDKVLFTNLSSGNNRIYEASGVGVSIAWEALKLFEGRSETPIASDIVIIDRGDAFADQQVLFNGTDFRVNDTVRFFDGANGTDYWELSSIKTSTLTDNTINGVVFSANVTNSENWIIDYSLTRGAGVKETGQIILTSDGASASIAKTNGFLGGDSGVEFNTDINSGDIRLLYTTTNSGSDATMKYSIKRWSNAAGGPGGPPSYSGFTGSSTAAAGAVGDIQFHGGTGNLEGNSLLKWDSTESAVNLNGLYIKTLEGPTVLLNNQATPQVIFSKDAATHRHAVIEYSLVRDGEFQTGRMLLVNDGTGAFVSDDFISTDALGITFSADISGSSVQLLYTSTATGVNANFKYNIRFWE